MTAFRPVVLVTGVLLIGLAAAMLAPMLVAMFASREEDWQAFAWSAAATGFVGAALAISARGPVDNLDVRAAFLLTVVSWVSLAAFAALPLGMSGELGAADAFFEAMSGLTTTGSTVMTGLELTDRAVLLWRAILQWIGGVGIVVTAIAILPLLKVGGLQLFRLESSDRSEKLLPRAREIAGLIALIYVGLTAICAIVYRMLGVPGFDAIAHAMTTIATGGFSTSDASMGAFMDERADIAAIFFMLAGGMPFGVYMIALRGNWRAALSDPQMRAFLALSGALVAIMTGYLTLASDLEFARAARLAAFNVVSILTGTGYATADYAGADVRWGPFAFAFFFLLTFVGGCAGSTTCGIKIFRFQVMFAALKAYLSEMVRPHGVAPIRYAGRKLTDDTVYSVLSFVFLYLASFAVLAIIMSLLGEDFTTAVSAAATSISNVGPGLGGTIGPAGTFASLPDNAKWVLSVGMLVGRLEVLAVLVLFAPSFWRS